MKKIIATIIAMITFISCSIIPSRVHVYNNEINKRATKLININKNIVVAKINISNVDTRAKDGYIYSILSYNYSVLGGVLSSNKGTIEVKTSLDVIKNKLYLKNPEILKITAQTGLEENEKIARIISDLIINSLTLKELYDFKNDFYVNNVYIKDNHIVLEIE